YISRKALLENMPKTIWLYRPVDFIKSVLRLNQTLTMIDNKYIDHSKSSFLVKIVALPSIIINKIKRR
ncbi:glycosyltransferase family 2 protein, partial [Yersinia enterocolitica]